MDPTDCQIVPQTSQYVWFGCSQRWCTQNGNMAQRQQSPQGADDRYDIEELPPGWSTYALPAMSGTATLEPPAREIDDDGQQGKNGLWPAGEREKFSGGAMDHDAEQDRA